MEIANRPREPARKPRRFLPEAGLLRPPDYPLRYIHSQGVWVALPDLTHVDTLPDLTRVDTTLTQLLVCREGEQGGVGWRGAVGRWRNCLLLEEAEDILLRL